MTGQVTVTIPATVVAQLADAGPDGPASAGISSGGTGIKAAVLRTAGRALARARRQAAADAAAPGGCAHTAATEAYRPTTKIRDYVTARDQTCRNPRCRQPARHADLDHTTPYDRGAGPAGAIWAATAGLTTKSSSSPAGRSTSPHPATSSSPPQPAAPTPPPPTLTPPDPEWRFASGYPLLSHRLPAPQGRVGRATSPSRSPVKLKTPCGPATSSPTRSACRDARRCGGRASRSQAGRSRRRLTSKIHLT